MMNCRRRKSEKGAAAGAAGAGKVQECQHCSVEHAAWRWHGSVNSIPSQSVIRVPEARIFLLSATRDTCTS
eukprot:gene14493-biopygen15672